MYLVCFNFSDAISDDDAENDETHSATENDEEPETNPRLVKLKDIKDKLPLIPAN